MPRLIIFTTVKMPHKCAGSYFYIYFNQPDMIETCLNKVAGIVEKTRRTTKFQNCPSLASE